MTGIRSALAIIMSVGVMALLTAPAHAEIYKWFDDKGMPHFTDKAPKDAKSTKVKVSDTTSSDAEDEINALNERRNAANADKKKAVGDADSAASAKDEAERNRKLCDQHRRNLATLKSGTRVLTKDAQGNQKYLTDEEIASQLQVSEGEVKRCDQQKVPAGAGAAPAVSKNAP